MIVTRKTSSFVPRPVVYVLEVNKRPILAFEALTGRDAKQLIHEAWLRQDLKRLRSNGRPLWDGKARLRVGVAVGAQVSEVKALLREASKGTELAIVYLTPLDST
jgi:hypothetical protein